MTRIQVANARIPGRKEMRLTDIPAVINAITSPTIRSQPVRLDNQRLPIKRTKSIVAKNKIADFEMITAASGINFTLSLESFVLWFFKLQLLYAFFDPPCN